MKTDLYEQLREDAENQFLAHNDLEAIEGGWDIGGNDNLNFIKCVNEGGCIGNNCDPANCGACPGNTTGGGPGTCPTSN